MRTVPFASKHPCSLAFSRNSIVDYVVCTQRPKRTFWAAAASPQQASPYPPPVRECTVTHSLKTSVPDQGIHGHALLASPRLATPLPKQPKCDGIDIRQRCTSAPVMPTRLSGVQTRLALNGRPLLPTPFRDANGPLRLEASMWNHQPHRTVLRRCCCTVLLRAFSRYIPSSTIVVCAHNAPSARSGQFKGRG